MSETKQFKLVYENAGELKGSYTGIPADDDTDVIKRAVLEGKEDPAPTPEPLNPSEVFNLGTFDLGAAIWDEETNSYSLNADTELVKKIMEIGEAFPVPFKITLETKEEVVESTHVVTNYEVEVISEGNLRMYNMEDVLIDDPTLTIWTNFEKLEITTDFESGDSYVNLYLKQDKYLY